jgi:hypothetical protein|tara:strand:+ start:1695 stop:1997 length:303 start_codon:yes stop_codon:yes gene_type:complete
MSNTVTPFPRLPTPAREVDNRYMGDLVRALEATLSVLQNPGPLRGTRATLTELQADNDVGLESGALYQVDGFVKIALVNVAACAGSTGTGAIGTVTVAVS